MTKTSHSGNSVTGNRGVILLLEIRITTHRIIFVLREKTLKKSGFIKKITCKK